MPITKKDGLVAALLKELRFSDRKGVPAKETPTVEELDARTSKRIKIRQALVRLLAGGK